MRPATDRKQLFLVIVHNGAVNAVAVPLQMALNAEVVDTCSDTAGG